MAKYEETTEVVLEKCPHCNGTLIMRQHKKIDEKVLAQPYFFFKWQYCKNCGYIQHKEIWKVKREDYGEVRVYYEKNLTLFDL
jgi:uncharacterized protein with PIN domain